MLRDLGHAPAFEMMEREQRAFVGGKVRQDCFHFISGGTRRGVWSLVNRVRHARVRLQLRWFSQPATTDRLASKIITARIRRNAQQPVTEGLLRSPLWQAFYHPQKRLLDEVIKVRLGANEAPEQARDRGVMSLDQQGQGFRISSLGIKCIDRIRCRGSRGVSRSLLRTGRIAPGVCAAQFQAVLEIECDAGQDFMEASTRQARQRCWEEEPALEGLVGRPVQTGVWVHDDSMLGGLLNAPTGGLVSPRPQKDDFSQSGPPIRITRPAVDGTVSPKADPAFPSFVLSFGSIWERCFRDP